MTLRPGEMVVPTPYAIDHSIVPADALGLVTAAEDYRVWVAIVGRKTISTYSRDFWTPVPPSWMKP